MSYPDLWPCRLDDRETLTFSPFSLFLFLGSLYPISLKYDKNESTR